MRFQQKLIKIALRLLGSEEYSLVLNKRTGTMKKNSLKFQAVLNLFCGTIESNSRFWDVVLLFQPLNRIGFYLE